MPYTRKQCNMFYAKKARGEKVPAHLSKYCKKGAVRPPVKGKK